MAYGQEDNKESQMVSSLRWSHELVLKVVLRGLEKKITLPFYFIYFYLLFSFSAILKVFYPRCIGNNEQACLK